MFDLDQSSHYHNYILYNSCSIMTIFIMHGHVIFCHMIYRNFGN